MWALLDHLIEGFIGFYSTTAAFLSCYRIDDKMAKLKIALLSIVVLLALVSLLLWNPTPSQTTKFTIKADDGNTVRITTTSKTNHFSESTHLEKSSSIPDLVTTVKKFVFFVGYARSGHSIIGTLMDAHPHLAIAYQYNIFKFFPNLNMQSCKKNLFESLFKKSVKDATNIRLQSTKGYTLAVSDQWQGKYDEYVEVIGDKCGGKTTAAYIKDKATFIKNFKKLNTSLSIPIRIIHAVRNPFDIISTAYIYHKVGVKQKLNFQAHPEKKLDVNLMRSIIKGNLKQFAAVHEMIEHVFGPENVLEIHNCDLVDDPKETISEIFRFLGVDISDEFMDVCAAKIFKSVSRSRDLIEWSPELREEVDKEIKKYTFFDRYSFTSLS